MIVSCRHWMQLRIVVLLAAMAWPSVGSADPARGAPMSRGSRVGYGREIGPRCRGPKSPANVELLQVIEGPLGQPGGPSTVFGMGLIEFGPPAPVIWSTSRGARYGTLARRHKSPCSSELHDELECLIRVQSLAAASRDQCEIVLGKFTRSLAHLLARCPGIFVCVGHDTCSSFLR